MSRITQLSHNLSLRPCLRDSSLRLFQRNLATGVTRQSTSTEPHLLSAQSSTSKLSASSSSSFSSLSSTTSAASATPATNLQPSSPSSTSTTPEFPPLPYHIHRTASQQLPVYQSIKRGLGKKETRIRKISGDLEALRMALRSALPFKDADREVKINQLARHVIVKGLRRAEIVKFLEGMNF